MVREHDGADGVVTLGLQPLRHMEMNIVTPTIMCVETNPVTSAIKVIGMNFIVLMNL